MNHRLAQNIFLTIFVIFLSAVHDAAFAAPQKPVAKFKLALPGYRFQFPRDHGSHPAFATEWWYYTGNLRASDGRRFGYQLTFFRTALAPQVQRKSKWAVRDAILGHFALSDIDNQKFYFCDRLARGAVGLGGADTAMTNKHPRVWLGDWQIQFSPRGQTIRAAGTDFNTANKVQPKFAIQLTQRPKKSPVLHGTNGVSQKAAGLGQASHYYSFTRLASRGTIRIGNETFAVEGDSWFDQEFGSNQLAKNQIGWDWFSLQLGDGREVMLYQMRLRGGGIDPYSSATIVEKNGRARHLKRSDFRITVLSKWKSALTGATYPARWKVVLPRENMTFEVQPNFAAQELVTSRSTGISYYEGSVRFSGRQNGRALGGVGYVELTGYDREFRGTF